MKIIAQLNLFCQDRQEWECESQSITQILEKIDITKTVNTGWRTMINDLPVTDFSVIAKDGDTVYIKLVPEGGDTRSTGAGMKAGGWAMVGLGIVSMFLGPVGIGIGAALIGAGIGMAASGHVLYNLDIPDVNNKEREQPEQDPSIRGSENQSRPLGTIPTLLGRRRIYPDLAANSYTWVDRYGDQYLYQLFCLGQAEQEIDTNTLKIEETLLKDYSASGSINNVLNGTDELIQVTIRQGKDTPPMITKCVHEIQLNAALKNKTEEGQDGSIIRTTPDKTEEIHLDIFFYNGLGKYNDDGDVVSTSVQLQAMYKRADQGDESYQSLGIFSYGSNTISGSELKTKRYMIHKTDLPAASYTVKVSRVTKDSEDNKIVDAVYVGSIRALKKEAPVSPQRCRLLTLMAVKIKVSEKLNNVIKQLNVISSSRLPSYSGSESGIKSWPYAVSSNPASAAIYAMTGGFSQQKLKDPEIDWPSFQALYQWCQDKGYECNEYIAESMPISNLLSRIASTCRAEIIRVNGRITVIQDIEKPAPVQLFTPRNSHGYTESIIMGDLPDAMSLQYTDEEAGFAKNELTIYNTTDGNKEIEPETTQDVPLWGVTSSVQARKLGMYKYAVSKNRPIVAKFSCDFEYLLCNKGDRIRYAGDIALTGISQGRIAGLIYNTSGQIIAVTTDEALAMEAGKVYGLRIRRQDGSIVLHQLVTENGEFKEAVFATALKNGEVNEGDLFSFGFLDNDSKEFVITDISCGENLSADITCTEYAPEIFGVDDPAFILPDYDPKITNVPAVLDGGGITLSNWQTWFTYHDQFDLPSKPIGDGTSNGWHRLATAQSVWVSAKNAKTIVDGQWSEPYPSRGLALEDLMNGTGIGAPDIPVIEKAIAQRDGIYLSIIQPLPGINNSISTYTVIINKGGNENLEMQFSGLNTTYLYQRHIDGYPEASQLNLWTVSVKATNIWDKESEVSEPKYINTDTYGTWELLAPTVIPQIRDRHITLMFSQPPRADNRKVYGDIHYDIWIRRPDIDKQADVWYTPGTSLNPYPETMDNGTEITNVLNYKTNSHEPETRGEMYVQTMPLKGQGGDGKSIENTLYLFKVVARNEAGVSSASIVQATALCTNIVDLVNANITQKEAYVPDLAAISANLGSINQGSMGNDNNRWDLSTFVDNKGVQRWEGLFRVGGENQYFHVIPVINDIGQIVDYRIDFKVGKFELTSVTSNIKGEVIVMAENVNYERTRITPTGTYYEYKSDEDGEWQVVARQTTSGLLSQVLFSEKSLLVANSSIESRRERGLDIGRQYLSENCLVYHFDTNFFDQHNTSPTPYTLDGTAQLVDASDNSPLSSIDFTPAIIAVAPYSEVGKSAYGRFSLTYPLGSPENLALDFWVQFVWSENTTIFEYGDDEMKIRLISIVSEPYYNVPQDDEPPYNYEIDEISELPYNVITKMESFIQCERKWVDPDTGKTLYDTHNIPLDDYNIELVQNVWMHIGISKDVTSNVVYINSKIIPIPNFVPQAKQIVIGDKKSFQLDELMVDTTVTLDAEGFISATRDKIPWGSLNYQEQHFILDAHDKANIKGNVMDLVRDLIKDSFVIAEPPGKISMYMGLTAPQGYLMCDGAEYDIDSYPLLATILLELPFNEGVADRKFRVPDLRKRVPEGASNNLGVYIEAGLPNITSVSTSYTHLCGWSGGAAEIQRGAIYGKNTGYQPNGGEYGRFMALEFVASKGETKTDGTLKTDDEYKVYGKSDTVQPNTFTTNYIIKT